MAKSPNWSENLNFKFMLSGQRTRSQRERQAVIHSLLGKKRLPRISFRSVFQTSASNMMLTFCQNYFSIRKRWAETKQNKTTLPKRKKILSILKKRLFSLCIRCSVACGDFVSPHITYKNCHVLLIIKKVIMIWQ